MKEMIVPAGKAIAFEVARDDTFRIAQVEGRQVADVVLINADNYKEYFSAGHSIYLNCIEGTGNIRKFTKFWSRPPMENVMATVIEDTVGVHFTYIGSRCSRMIYKLRHNIDAPPHRTCQDNLAEALAPHGLSADEIPPEVFNLWMNVEIDDNGCFRLKPSLAGPSDFIELKANMNLLIGVSACPSDMVAVNDFRIKPLKVVLSS
jgi:uncharacterized protein YcgI (DUF1989 family)